MKKIMHCFNIKRNLRIIKIYFNGHYSLITKIRIRRYKEFISKFNILTPDYYNSYGEKYGNEDFVWWLTEIGKDQIPKTKTFFHFENGVIEVPDTTNVEPITITLTQR